MVRPSKRRLVRSMPGVVDFKPRGIPMRDLQEVYLPLDGFEAVRLCDLEGLDQEVAARRMDVSRQTLGRILASARSTIARALVQGMALRIEGGHVRVIDRESVRSGYGGDTSDPGETHVDILSNEEIMSKIAVSSEGPTLDDPVAPRFGRAPAFLIVDAATMACEHLSNRDTATMVGGAGIHAAQMVASHGAEVVLTGKVGPKALQALTAANIAIGENVEGMSVREAVERYRRGEIQVVRAGGTPDRQP